MDLIFWWMILVWVVGIGGYFIAVYLLKKYRNKSPISKSVPIAHSNILTNLPEYTEALRQYRILMRVVLVSVSVALLSSIILSARPASVTFVTPAQQSRDVMLCLDVSGSVLRADARLVNRFSSLVTGFADQRFGLTVFNSSSVAVLPLTDDHQFMTDRLKVIGDALAAQEGQEFTNITSGTLAAFDKGTSLVSDGVTTCMNNLGENPRNRSQSVILATDNEANGTPIVTYDQATEIARDRNIRIYAIDPGESDVARRADHEQLQKLAESTGGNYQLLSDENAVNEIIDSISEQESQYANSTSVVAVADEPKILAYIASVATIMSVIVLWRLRS